MISDKTRLHRRPLPTPLARLTVLLLTLAVSPAMQSLAADAAATAREILDASGVQGGVVVHLGCGDGSLTAALRVDDRYVVHGMDLDAEVL